MSSVIIREARASDLAAVGEIYTFESEHAYSTFETQRRPLADWQHKLGSGDPFLVAVSDEGVLGFAYASPFRDRPAYHRTRETSVYLDRTARGRSLGTRLYAELVARLRADGFHTALALIALPNEASVRLHRAHGFEHAGTMREVGDKQDRLIDVGVYQLMLQPQKAGSTVTESQPGS
ncbi:MAG: GNAT family N-acetyltransferase [Propionibacteriales bacterium]|nr:GNAT family N-acetyltransferase [Propionibacteriales bacterium]